MTVFENVAFGLRVKPRRERPSEAVIREKVHELLEARATRLARAALSVGAFGRPAPAHRACPRARGRTEGAAARRAVRRARCQGPQGIAQLAAASARRASHLDDLRHARPGRSARSGGPDRRVESRARGAGRQPAGRLRSSADVVRLRVPRRGEPAEGQRRCERFRGARRGQADRRRCELRRPRARVRAAARSHAVSDGVGSSRRHRRRCPARRDARRLGAHRTGRQRGQRARSRTRSRDVARI